MATHRTAARRVLRRGGVTLAGLTAVAAAVAVTQFPQALALPAEPAPQPAVHAVGVEAPPESWVCPGPAVLPDPKASSTGQFAAKPTKTTSTAQLFAAGGDATASGLGGVKLAGLGDVTTKVVASGAGPGGLGVPDNRGPLVLEVDPGPGDTADNTSAVATASVGSLTTSGDLRGLAGATCERPGVDHWLVGGSTELGTSTQLIIQNPGKTPATVSVDVWGAGGVVALGSGRQRLVAPGKETTILVGAAAPEERRIVVHVSATGGLVTAYLQHNILDGLLPLGTDFIVPSAAPARTTVVSGVVSLGEPVDGVHAPALRVLVPGTQAATAHLELVGPRGTSTPPGTEAITVEPGKVTDISLGGTDPGWYAVVITADQPVVAGGYVDRMGAMDTTQVHPENQYDRAWLASWPLEAKNVSGDIPVEAQRAPGAASSSLGRLALIAGTTSQISISALPAAGAAGETFHGVLTAYGVNGALLARLNVEVPQGQTRTVPATDVAAGAAVITLDRAVGADVDGDAEVPVVVWNVLASAGPAASATATEGSLITVLQPETWQSVPRTVRVRPDDRLGTAG